MVRVHRNWFDDDAMNSLARSRFAAWLVPVAVAAVACVGAVAADDRPIAQTQSIDPDRTFTGTHGSSNSNTRKPKSPTSPLAAPTPEEIAAWIVQLDDHRYVVRERATRQLLLAEVAVLDPLLVVANAARPEPADRAVWVLRRIATSKDAAVRRQALERLVQLQNRPLVVAAARDALAQIHHEEAVEAIRQLGGKFTTPYADAFGPYMAGRVILDKQWRGGDEGLVHLRHVIGLRHVIIIGTDVSLGGLQELVHMPDLDELWLYGTKLRAADVPQIRSLLPQVTIDFRLGALLGVGSNTPDGNGPAVVGTVQGVAAAAGIQVGDIIQKFEGQPVPDFKTLTEMIGKHVAGDEVTLEVLRGGQPIEFKIKLGQWETYNF
jgi:hypothetical protein